MSQFPRKRKNNRVNENDRNQSQLNLLYEHPRSQSLSNPNLENCVPITQPDTKVRFPSTPKRTGWSRKTSDREITTTAIDLSLEDANPKRKTRNKSFPMVLSNLPSYGPPTEEIPAKIFQASNQNPQGSVSCPRVGNTVHSTTRESGGTASGAGPAIPSSPYKPLKVNRLQRRKRKRSSPDITEATNVKQEVEDDDSSSSSSKVSEAETVVAEEPVSGGSSTSQSKKNMAGYDTPFKRRDSIINGRPNNNSERCVAPQTNRRHHNLNHDKFTIKGVFHWLEQQISNSIPKSNKLRLLTEILKRKEVFLILQHDLLAIKSNPYLMERKSLDDLFVLLLRNLRSLIEGEMNAMISDYQGVLGILTPQD